MGHSESSEQKQKKWKKTKTKAKNTVEAAATCIENERKRKRKFVTDFACMIKLDAAWQGLNDSKSTKSTDWATTIIITYRSRRSKEQNETKKKIK